MHTLFGSIAHLYNETVIDSVYTCILSFLMHTLFTVMSLYRLSVCLYCGTCPLELYTHTQRLSSNEVVFHWGCLLVRSSSTETIFHWDDLPMRRSSTEDVFNWGHLTLRLSFTELSSLEIVFHWYRLPLRWSLPEVIFHWGYLSLGSSLTKCAKQCYKASFAHF